MLLRVVKLLRDDLGDRLGATRSSSVSSASAARLVGLLVELQVLPGRRRGRTRLPGLRLLRMLRLDWAE